MHNFRVADRVQSTETKRIRYGTVIECVRPHLTVRWDGEDRVEWIHYSSVRSAPPVENGIVIGDRVQYDSDPREWGTVIDVMYVIDWDNWGVEGTPSYGVRKKGN